MKNARGGGKSPARSATRVYHVSQNRLPARLPASQIRAGRRSTHQCSPLNLHDNFCTPPPYEAGSGRVSRRSLRCCPITHHCAANPPWGATTPPAAVPLTLSQRLHTPKRPTTDDLRRTTTNDDERRRRRRRRRTRARGTHGSPVFASDAEGWLAVGRRCRHLGTLGATLSDAPTDC
jgi:hypothetical protein